MATNYPNSFDSWTDKIDRVDIYAAAHINEAYERILKIQQTLGINPQGPFLDVAARIADLEIPVVPFLFIGILDYGNIIPSGLAQELIASVA